MKKALLHGEAIVFESKIPNGAKRIKKSDYLIIAPSEQSGNHHVIDAVDGVEFYEKDGVLFVRNDVETNIRCLVKERHDNITLPAGEWEIGIQQEYDYFTLSKRNVAD